MRISLLTSVTAAALMLAVPALAEIRENQAGTVLLAQKDAAGSGGAEELPRNQSGGGGEGSGATGQGESTSGGGEAESGQGTSGGGGAESGQGTSGGGGSGEADQSGKAGDSGANTEGGSGTNKSGGGDEGGGAGGKTGDAGDSSKKGAGEGGGSTNINITTEQRTEISRAFSSVNVESVDIDIDLSVGVVVPERVTTLHTCPGEVIRILQGLPSCRYIVVRNRIVIINPSTRRVVTIIERRA
jgi:hypothetical protein